MIPRPALAWRSVLVAWLLAVGVDLFFNAGVLSGLFDQAREPSLLPDDVLFARIPVAYAALAVGTTALAWVIDHTDRAGARRGATVGALMGVTVALLGVVYLWTAIDMTAGFVIAGAAVQIVEFAVAGAFLGAFRLGDVRRLTRIGLLSALALAIVSVVVQNVIGS